MRVTHVIVSSIIFAIASFNVNADYTVDKGNTRTKTPQDIVITLGEGKRPAATLWSIRT